MNEAIYKLPNIPPKYEFKYSYCINKFKTYNHIENIDDITIDNIRNIANIDYNFLLKLIDELVLRGFRFITNTPQSILPKFSINTNNYRYIYTDKDTKKYTNINFEMFLIGDIVKKFNIESDLFFNYIPIEAFKYFNSNIDLDLLAFYFKKYGFKIVCFHKENEKQETPLGQQELIEDQNIEIQDKLISNFLIERKISNNKEEIEKLNKNDLLLIKGVGLTRIGRFIKELKLRGIELQCNNYFKINSNEKIENIDLSCKFKKYCKSKKIKNLIDLINTDFIKLVMKNKMTLEDVETLLSNDIKDKKSIKYNELINIINENSKSSKTINIFLEEVKRNKIENLEDLKKWDYKNIFRYDVTPVNLFDCTNILGSINYEYVNNIKFIYETTNDIKDILSEKYKKIYSKLKELNITQINQLKNFNLLLLIKESNEINKTKEFINDIFLIEEHKINEFLHDIKEIDSDIYGYCENCNYKTIKDINFIDIFQKYDIEEFLKLINEINIKYEDDNLTLYLYKKLEEIKKQSTIDILYKKINNNYTLEKIGQELTLSRERIRQIINRAEEKFQTYIKIISKIIEEYLKKNKFISQQDFLKIYPPNDAKVIKYLIVNSDIKEMEYIEDLEIFIIPNTKNILSIYDKIINQLGDIFYYYDEIDNIQNILEEEQIDYLPIECFERYLNKKGYHLIKNIYCKAKNNTFLFNYIVKKYFKNGIKTDDAGLEELKEKIQEVFGNEIEYSKESHAIKSGLLRDKSMILCDNNKYIHFDNVKIDRHLINKIRKELINILKNKNNVSPHTLFDMFKNELLEKTSINNEKYLYGILRFFYQDEFQFKRLNILKIDGDYNNLTKTEIIEEYILSRGEAVLRSEVMDKFDLNEDICNNIIAISEDLIYWDKYKKIQHINLVAFTDELKSIIIQAIEKMKNKRKYVTVYAVYKEIELDLVENKINDVDSLYNVLKIKLEDKYNFKQNFILDKSLDIDKFDIDYLIKDYFKDFILIERNDIVKFTEDMNFKSSKASSVLSRLQKELFKIDIDTYIMPENVNISENEINQIKDFINQKINNKEYLILKDTEVEMYLLPKEEYFEWNQYSLSSIIKKELSQYFKEIEKETIDWRYYIPIIVRKESKINNFSDLIIYIMKDKLKVKYIRLSKLKEYLIRENIIRKDISKEFLEDPRIEFKDGIIELLEEAE